MFVEVSGDGVEAAAVEDSDGERVRTVVVNVLRPASDAAVQTPVKARHPERLHRQYLAYVFTHKSESARGL